MSIASSLNAASADRLAAESITSLAALQGLARPWERLWRDAHARPFQSPAWLIPWWKHVGRGRLASVAVHEQGRLVGLAPLYVFEDGTRRLFPLGIATTDYLDVLAEPDRQDEVLRAVASHVERDGGWDVLEAPQLHEGAHLLRCCWPAQWQRDLRECEPHPVLPLTRPLPAGVAKRLAYAQRRIAREGVVEYLTASASEVAPWLDELARLHASRWALREQPGVLGAAGVLDWHRESAARLHEQGLLRLLALRFEGRTIAMLYCLADAAHVAHRRWYYYIGGFDPDFSTLGPGTLLVGHAIGQARADGATHFDFLRGGEPYKYRWGAIDQPMFALRVTRSARPA